VQLAPYYDPSIYGRSIADRAAAEHEEARWAALIRDALQAKEMKTPVVEANPIFVPGGDDLESDARLLAGISRELAAR
jgi:hypothetical protein